MVIENTCHLLCSNRLQFDYHYKELQKEARYLFFFLCLVDFYFFQLKILKQYAKLNLNKFLFSRIDFFLDLLQ